MLTGRIVGLVCLLGALGSACQTRKETHENAPATLDALEARAPVEGLSELLIVGVEGLDLSDADRQTLHGLRPGGICLYGRNVATEPQLRRLIGHIHESIGEGSLPLVAIDQEGGTVVRIPTKKGSLPSAMAMGATRSARLTEAAGAELGVYLRHLGITMNFAPVLEPLVNPESDVIGVRSFSDQPALVGQLGSAFIRGLQRANVAAVAKHFPGHGESADDSHETLPRLQLSRERLLELISPFGAAIRDAQVDGIMTAHVVAPALSNSDLPATVSKPILTDLLKKDMSFKGLVVTDALNMKSILQHADMAEAAVQSIVAGADMVIVPFGPAGSVLDALKQAAQSGRLPSARARDAIAKVRALKDRRAVGTRSTIEASEQDTPRAIAERSITLVKTAPALLPLSPGIRVGVVTTSSEFARAARQVPQTFDDVRFVEKQGFELWTNDKALSGDSLARAEKTAREADVTIAALINPWEMPVFELVRRTAKRVVLVSLGRPIILAQGESADGLMATYSYSEVSCAAAVRVLTGELEASGRLPVSLPQHAFGSGFNVRGTALLPGASEL